MNLSDIFRDIEVFISKTILSYNTSTVNHECVELEVEIVTATSSRQATDESYEIYLTLTSVLDFGNLVFYLIILSLLDITATKK